MVEPAVALTAAEPEQWFVVFHPSASSRWLEILAAGRFKHVSAFSYVEGSGVWLFCDSEWRGLRLVLAGEAAARGQIARYAASCAIVSFKRGAGEMGLSARLGLTCVTVVRHLLRVTGWVLRPDDLYRHLLKNGGLLVNAGESPGRSHAPAGAGAGSE